MPSSSRAQFRRGQAMLTTVLFLLLASAALIANFATIAIRETQASRLDMRGKQSYFLAEAGMEDIIWRIQNNKQYSPSETLALNGSTATLSVADVGSSKVVTGSGDVSGAVRKAQATINIGTTGVGFFYGVQISDGGLEMENNARVNGNVYSNGSITGSSGTTITGDAIVAGGIGVTPDLAWGANNADQFFANSANTIDIAQSFIAPATDRLNRVSVYLAKVGNPGTNLMLRITADNGGKPSTSSLASAAISFTTVGTTGSWVDVSFSSPPNLVVGTKYWIVLDYNSSSGTNYWNWRKDSTDAYAGNTGRTTADWSSGSAVWTDAGGDLNFQIWVGGINTQINGLTIGSATSGTAQANLFVNTSVHGSSCPNPYCIVTNPPRAELPISAGVIQDWKDAALAGGTCVSPQCDASGNLAITNGASKSIGPIKIPGNLTLSNNATLIVTGTIWVAGSVNLSNNCIVNLSPAYGSLSGVIVSDGTIAVSNNCVFSGSGSAGSYIMLLSDKNAPASNVIDVSNNSTGVIYYASRGRIELENNASAKEVTGYGLELENNATVTYESGLANTQFSSGPSAGWVIQGWNEVK